LPESSGNTFRNGTKFPDSAALNLRLRKPRAFQYFQSDSLSVDQEGVERDSKKKNMSSFLFNFQMQSTGQ
jgi:hypothetical protein